MAYIYIYISVIDYIYAWSIKYIYHYTSCLASSLFSLRSWWPRRQVSKHCCCHLWRCVAIALPSRWASGHRRSKSWRRATVGAWPRSWDSHVDCCCCRAGSPVPTTTMNAATNSADSQRQLRQRRRQRLQLLRHQLQRCHSNYSDPCTGRAACGSWAACSGAASAAGAAEPDWNADAKQNAEAKTRRAADAQASRAAAVVCLKETRACLQNEERQRERESGLGLGVGVNFNYVADLPWSGSR